MDFETSVGAVEFSGEKPFITEQQFLSGRLPPIADKTKQKNISDARKALVLFKTAKGSVRHTVKKIDREERHVRNMILHTGLWDKKLPPEFDESIRHAAQEWNFRCAMEKLKALRTINKDTTLCDLESTKLEEECIFDPIEEFGVTISPKTANKLKMVAKDYHRTIHDGALNGQESAKSYINHYRENILKCGQELIDQFFAAGFDVSPDLFKEITAINGFLTELNNKAIKSAGSFASEKSLPGKRNSGWKNGQNLSQATL